MKTIKEIEEAMAGIVLSPPYQPTLKEFHRLLKIMGNVDDDEIVSLVLLAAFRVGRGEA